MLCFLQQLRHDWLQCAALLWGPWGERRRGGGLHAVVFPCPCRPALPGIWDRPEFRVQASFPSMQFWCSPCFQGWALRPTSSSARPGLPGADLLLAAKLAAPPPSGYTGEVLAEARDAASEVLSRSWAAEGDNPLMRECRRLKAVGVSAAAQVGGKGSEQQGNPNLAACKRQPRCNVSSTGGLPALCGKTASED